MTIMQDGELPLTSETQTNEVSTTLLVPECSREDSGRYMLTLTNNSGSKSIGIRVRVLGNKNIL